MYTVLNFCSTSSKGFFFNFSVVAHTIAHSTSFALDSSSCLRQYTILDQNCILSLMALAGMQIKACYGTQTRPRRPRRYHIWLDCRFTKEILYAIANGKRKKKTLLLLEIWNHAEIDVASCNHHFFQSDDVCQGTVLVCL
jgi:hypothetical protein